jgi:hypothetical protein
VGPEIWFRIVHSAVPSENCALREAYREQEVEVALGSIDIGVLTRRIEADQGVRVVPSARAIPKPTGPKTPRVTELLRKAIEWQRQLDAGEVRNQADIARREGITRARVTQIMGLLRVAPETREHILTLPDVVHRPPISERMLRPIATITAHHGKLGYFPRF